MEEQRDLFSYEEERRWHHYLLCDPRCEGPEAVRYVGRAGSEWGCRRRFGAHMREARNMDDPAYGYASKRGIRKMWREGVEPVQVYVGVGGESEETRLIEYWESLGAILWNHTRGGEGLLGMHHTQETRRKMSASQKVALNCPTVKRRLSEVRRALRSDPEWRKKQSESMKLSHSRPEVKVNLSKASRDGRRRSLNSSMNEARAEYVRVRYSLGDVTLKALGGLFGLTVSSMSRIASGARWGSDLVEAELLDFRAAPNREWGR